MADHITLERLGEVFAEKDRRASANYAVDINGGVALYVEEKTGHGLPVTRKMTNKRSR